MPVWCATLIWPRRQALGLNSLVDWFWTIPRKLVQRPRLFGSIDHHFRDLFDEMRLCKMVILQN
jgi:hypothetical protein